MTLIERIHAAYVGDRRARVLARHLAELIPPRSRVLDVGCGDGHIDRLVRERREDLELRGIDVLVRPTAEIPVDAFDGARIPQPDGAFDVVLFVDVLHHSDDPMRLLREGARVASRALIVKDHTQDGILARQTLRFMDDVGNARFGVALPHDYWSRERWRAVFRELGLEVERWEDRLGLYPPPASWIFGRSLHFLARLALEGAPES